MQNTDNLESMTEAVDNSINNHVRAYMNDNGLSYAQMAKLLGTTSRTLKLKLEGRSAWRISHLFALSDLKGVTLGELLGI